MVVTHDEKVAARAMYRYTLESGILTPLPQREG
jgi:predicted ABC-type transport system involved in lysophospholipase L1 biosynthesis ATPase subunit